MRTSTSPCRRSRTASAPSPSCIQLPIGAENDFVGVVDLVYHARPRVARRRQGRRHHGRQVRDRRRSRPTCRRRPRSTAWHLVERVAESDDELMEKYLGGEELTPEELKAGIRKLTVNSELYPVLCGSAFKNRGVQPMLDAVVDYLPVAPRRAPDDRPQAGQRGGRADPRAEQGRAVLGPGVQGRHAPVLRHADLHPRLLGPHQLRARSVVNSTKGRRSASGSSSRCTPTRRTPSRRPSPATSTRPSASRTPRPATPCRPRTSRSCSSR